MHYMVYWASGSKAAGPYAVLDTAIHEARRLTRYGENVTDDRETVEGLLSPMTLVPTALVAVVKEVGGYGASRVRAFADDGVISWAKECKSCAAKVAAANCPTNAPHCGVCDSLRAVRDRS